MNNEKTVERIVKRLEELDAESAKLDEERKNLHTTLHVIERISATAEGVFPANNSPIYSGIAIDFTGANNLGDRLARIGRSVEGRLDTKEMARCLIEREVSKASFRNLRASIINQLRDDPDFEKVGRGQYRYLPQSSDLSPEMTFSSS